MGKPRNRSERPSEGCPACAARGKDWKGQDPTCGFPQGVFSDENWNCATLNDLRDAVADRQSREHCEEQSCVTVPISDCGEFLVLNWYKNRGRTDGCIVIDGPRVRNATLGDVSEAMTMLRYEARCIAREKDEAF